MQLDELSAQQPDWFLNKSSFKSIPLKLVIDELERQYNIAISVENVNTDRLFTGSFEHNDLEAALEVVTIPFNLTYKKQGNSSYRIE